MCKYIHSYMNICIYPHTRVSSFPRLISVAWVNEKRTTDVTRVLKAPVLSFAKWLVVWWKNKKYSVLISVLNECSSVFSSECSMNKFRIYIYTYIHIAMYIFIHMAAKVWKVQNKSFQLVLHSLLHIDTQALTSHLGTLLLSMW